jgi:transcription initiation factor TFIIIB Brf1 subunit/transcription initiation factor TFIIB
MDDFLLFENALNAYNKINHDTNFKDEKIPTSSIYCDSSEDEDNIYENNEYTEYDENENNNEEGVILNNIECVENIKKQNDEYNNLKNDNSLCKHKNISNENGSVLCFECGKELEKTLYQDKEWRYYGVSDSRRTSDPNRVHIRKIDDRSIYKDVENMGFSDKIIHLANQIYLQVTKGQILRGNSRKSVVFACTFHSFKIKENAQTHDKLIKIFNLNKKTALKGLKYVSLNAPKDSLIHTTYITPENIIEDIMDKFNAKEEQKKEVIDIYNKIKNKSSKINRSRPQSIAAGVVYFFICYKNIDVSIKHFAKKVELSELTILKIAKVVSEVLEIVPETWL